LIVPPSPPEPLADHHQLDRFNCGVSSLDLWLQRRARANQASDASRTYVVCDGNRVVAYYALASGSIAVEDAPGRFRRNMPQPIPAVILGRLAVDTSLHGQGIGRALFRDAATRVLNAASTIGIRGIVVHAISEEARRYYLALGFAAGPRDPFVLMVTLADLRANL